MNDAEILAQIGVALNQFLMLALPPLGAALVAGLTVGIAQAATQIQDQTLPQTVKLLVVVAVLAIFVPLLSSPLVEQAKQLFNDFPLITARSS